VYLYLQKKRAIKVNEDKRDIYIYICMYKSNHHDLLEYNLGQVNDPLFSSVHPILKFQCLIYDHQLHHINNFSLTTSIHVNFTTSESTAIREKVPK
jgi:hypothetical protein